MFLDSVLIEALLVMSENWGLRASRYNEAEFRLRLSYLHEFNF